MILYVKGDLFESPAQVLVNTVNTEGVMGKGLALDFKRAFPEMYEEYRRLCEAGTMQVGGLWLYKSPNKWVLNFPTKRHWRQPSRLEYIEAGLRKFANCYTQMGVHSIAFPALGCGLGQLDFATQVQPLMEKYLRRLPIDVFIYPVRASGATEQAEVSKWLRTEPSSLSFAKVWEDLQVVLGKTKTFTLLQDDKHFTASLSGKSKQLKFHEGKHTCSVDYDALAAVWQQLRTHGFTSHQIAPNIDGCMIYLIPLLSQLDYVGVTAVADSYEDLQDNSTLSLQVLPAAFARPSEQEATINPAQYSLF